MKTVIAALTVLTFAAGAATAAAPGARHGNPGDSPAPSVTYEAVQVPAETVKSPVELNKMGLKSDDLVTVTSFTDTRRANGFVREER